MGHLEIVTAYSDSPRRELSVRDLGFVVALTVCCQINVSCAYTGREMQL